ncbi:MAG: molecular chaperone TorD family protein [Slackia sp.]|nr:molecular chaperone TorD family protein [Slackia sp.]
MGGRYDIFRAIGIADTCELLSAAFSFPDEALSEALSDGSFQDDIQSCFSDVGIAAQLDGHDAWKRLLRLRGGDSALLFERMRRAYSFVYLTPGNPEVFLYEGAFLQREAGRGGVVSLFQSAATIDVERSMKEAGVITQNARRIPCDSVACEFSFLSFLAGSFAAEIQEGDAEQADRWLMRLRSFYSKHANRWIPPFFDQTKNNESADIYSDFASMGEIFMRHCDGLSECADKGGVR